MLWFQYKKILRRLPSKWLTFYGGSLHLCKVNTSPDLFSQAHPNFRAFIHLGIHSDLVTQFSQDLPA